MLGEILSPHCEALKGEIKRGFSFPLTPCRQKRGVPLGKRRTKVETPERERLAPLTSNAAFELILPELLQQFE